MAACAFLHDYPVNVAVGISAGIAAVVSAIPALHRFTLTLCLLVLLILTIINLRGVRESGLAFGLPTFAFVFCLGATVIIGLVRVCLSGAQPQPVVPPAALPASTQAMSAWILLRTF